MFGDKCMSIKYFNTENCILKFIVAHLLLIILFIFLTCSIQNLNKSPPYKINKKLITRILETK